MRLAGGQQPQHSAPPVLSHVLTCLQGQTADEEKVKEYTQELEGVLDAFETILSSRPYLAGE